MPRLLVDLLWMLAGMLTFFVVVFFIMLVWSDDFDGAVMSALIGYTGIGIADRMRRGV